MNLHTYPDIYHRAYPEASTQFQHHRIKATKCNTYSERNQATVSNPQENESEGIRRVGPIPSARSRLVAIIINVHNLLHSAQLNQQQITLICLVHCKRRQTGRPRLNILSLCQSKSSVSVFLRSLSVSPCTWTNKMFHPGVVVRLPSSERQRRSPRHKRHCHISSSNSASPLLCHGNLYHPSPNGQ